MEKKYVWITGQVIDHEQNQWLFGSVYDNKEEAVKNCLEENWFVARVTMNEPSKTIEHQFELAWYPNLEDEPEISE
jgi:hypothetical protein